MATNTHFILTLQPRYPYSPSSSSSSSFPFILTNTALSFSHLRFGSLPLSLNFRASFSFKSPTSTISAFSDAEEDEEEEEEDEEDDEEEEEDEDDDVAADEYDDVSADASEDDAGVFARHDGFKWQRVEKLCNEVREFGADIIDVEELAAVYDFRIDKFQVRWAFVSLRFEKFPRIWNVFMRFFWFGWVSAAGDTGLSERLLGGGFCSDEQREDADCGGRGGGYGG